MSAVLYDLKLRIAYDYAGSVGTSRSLVRVFPRELPGSQSVLSKQIEIDPIPAERSSFIDPFGNEAHDVLLRGDHSHLEIVLRAQVERMGVGPIPHGAPELGALAAELAGIRALGPDLPHHFTGRSPRVRPGRTTTDFAMDSLPADVSTTEAVQFIGKSIHDYMTFDSDATAVDTTHEVAFEHRRGVCQDFTHIMLACLRGVGIPAAYVSGYIRTLPPEGQQRLEGADAMHAWVRAWCGADIGWIEYDPTNALIVSDEHIVVAYGRDYSDVAPVKGVLKASGSHEGSQQVDLVELAQLA